MANPARKINASDVSISDSPYSDIKKLTISAMVITEVISSISGFGLPWENFIP